MTKSKSIPCKTGLGKKWELVRMDDAGMTFMRHDEWNNAIQAINGVPDASETSATIYADSYRCSILKKNDPVINAIAGNYDNAKYQDYKDDNFAVLDLLDAGIHHLPQHRIKMTDKISGGLLSDLTPNEKNLSMLWKCAI
jgi:hypothetical protein